MNKLSEVRAIMSDVAGLEVRSRDVKGLNEIQGSIEEVAVDKCSRAAEVVSFIPCFFHGFDAQRRDRSERPGCLPRYL
jgi:hypothetical protein